MQKRLNLMVFSFISLIVWLRLLKEGVGTVSNLELTLASVLYFVCLIPLLSFLVKKIKNVPYVPIFAIFYFINFGLGIFNNYQAFDITNITQDVVIRLLILILGGIVSLLIAFYTPIFNMLDSLLPKAKFDWDPKNAYRLSVYTGIVGIITHYILLAKNTPFLWGGLVGFISDLSRLSIAILFLLFLQKQLTLKGKMFLWIILGIRIFLDIGTGSTGHVLTNLSLLFFIYFYHKQRIPWLASIIVGIIFIVIFGARDEFRRQAWFGEYYKASPIQKTILYLEITKERILEGKESKLLEDYERLSGRTNILATFAQVTELTPQYIPYWGGYSYQTIFTSFLPRFLMPGKPMKFVGQEFGHRYGFLDPFDKTTSYNLPVLVEMYVNFGPLGIIIGMFILGALFKIFYILFNHPDISEGGAILSSVIFMNFLNLDSDFSLMFGNVIHYIILLYIIIKFNIIKSKPRV